MVDVVHKITQYYERDGHDRIDVGEVIMPAMKMFTTLHAVWLPNQEPGLVRKPASRVIEFNIHPGYTHYSPDFINTQQFECVVEWSSRLATILDHIKYVWCAGNDGLYEYVLDWLAHAIQTGTSPKTFLVLIEYAVDNIHTASNVNIMELLNSALSHEPLYYVYEGCINGAINTRTISKRGYEYRQILPKYKISRAVMADKLSLSCSYSGNRIPFRNIYNPFIRLLLDKPMRQQVTGVVVEGQARWQNRDAPNDRNFTVMTCSPCLSGDDEHVNAVNEAIFASTHVCTIRDLSAALLHFMLSRKITNDVTKIYGA